MITEMGGFIPLFQIGDNMGRVTELIYLLNQKKVPDKEEKKTLYNYISFTDTVMSIRRKYRVMINKQNKETK